MSNNYISSTDNINSCHSWTDEYMKNVADSENDNFTSISNCSTSDSGWSTPTSGWATPLSGYGTPVGVGTPCCRRRIRAENNKDEICVGRSCSGQRNKDESILRGKYLDKSWCRCISLMPIIFDTANRVVGCSIIVTLYVRKYPVWISSLRSFVIFLCLNKQRVYWVYTVGR
jgi:hypothetical protein